MVDTVDVTLARDPLMPNPRLKPLPPLHPKLRLKLNPTTDTVDTMVDTMAVPTDTDTDTVISAKGLLKPNLSLTTDTVDTDMVDTVDTTAVDTTGVEMDTSG